MDTDRDITPDPDLVTPETDPTPEEVEGEKELDAFERFAGDAKPADGGGPLP